MICGFMTVFPKRIESFGGEPTFFVEKIIKGLETSGIIDSDKRAELISEAIEAGFYNPEFNGLIKKVHTIRTKKRWRSGMTINFFVDVRKKGMFRFAPDLPCTGTQDIKIIWNKQSKGLVTVLINDKLFFAGSWMSNVHQGMNELANNDGFQTSEDFFTWFNEDFHGDIVHWTDRRYGVLNQIKNLLK